VVARTMFFVTIVPLPVVAIVFLVTRRLIALRLLDWTLTGQTVVIPAACACALLLALLSWKYRPKAGK
jgi:hypothetical protein